MKNVGTKRTTKFLIPKFDTTRPFGYDPMQVALGRLPPSDQSAAGGSEYGLQLNGLEFQNVTKTLLKASEYCNTRKPILELEPCAPSSDQSENNPALDGYVITRKFNRSKIRYTARVRQIPNRYRPRIDPNDRSGLHDSNEFVIDIRCANLRTTEMHVQTQKDKNGNYWINVRANPTALINGYNALGVAFKGKSWWQERALLLQVPFLVLTELLRAVDRKFEWTVKTGRRIEDLQFKLCPVQIFTGMPTGEFKPDQFLGFLRAALACPYGDGGRDFGVLADLLGVSVESRLLDGKVQTLLLKFVRDGRLELSVNLYDKNAKATVDAAVVGLAVTDDDEVLDFLTNSVRVDVTLHDGALRELMAEAQLGSKQSVSLTAKNFNEAVRALNLKQGRSGQRFTQWLLTYIFDTRLALVRLLQYRPSLIDKATEVLAAYNPEAAAVFAEAADLGFVYTTVGGQQRTKSFLQFAEVRLSRQQARTTREKLLRIGLDPDIPRAAYELLYSISHVWNLPPDRRIALNRAIERRQTKQIFELMKDSRGNSTQVFKQVRGLMRIMIATAHVPAITVRPDRRA